MNNTFYVIRFFVFIIPFIGICFLEGRTEYYKGDLFFIPKEEENSILFGEQISKAEYSDDGLFWICTTYILSPGKQPEINACNFYFNPETNIADIAGVDSSTFGQAEIKGTLEKWSEINIKLSFEKDGSNYIAKLHEKNHGDYISIEEDLYQNNESDESFIGKFAGSMISIDSITFNNLIESFVFKSVEVDNQEAQL